MALRHWRYTAQPPAWTPERDADAGSVSMEQQSEMGSIDASKTSEKDRESLKKSFALCSRLLIYLPRVRRNFKATPDRALYPEVKVDNRLA